MHNHSQAGLVARCLQLKSLFACYLVCSFALKKLVTLFAFKKNILIMKTTKLILCTLMAMMAITGYAASRQSEGDVRQRVEQMKQVGYPNEDQILTEGLQAAIAHAHSIFNISEDDTYVGFEWAPGVLDVCGDKEPQVMVSKVKMLDDTHAAVNMLYVDQPCYEIPYTLHLLWEGETWKIDDVTYTEQSEGWQTLRQQCDSFYDMTAEGYRTEPAQDVLANMLSYEITAEQCADPACFYYNNPKEIQHLIDQINNGHELFKKNPGYTPAMGKKLNDMVARIKRIR